VLEIVNSSFKAKTVAIAACPVLSTSVYHTLLLTEKQ